MKKIYLAIPYSGMEELSFKVANEVAAKLMNEGYIVFSPISHSHPLAVSHQMPGTWDFWKKFDESFILGWCDEVWVVVIGEDGYGLCGASRGVCAEILMASQNDIPVKYYDYERVQKV